MAEEHRLMESILHHLRGQLQSGKLNEEQSEGLEVAIQCLESIYDIKDTPPTGPPLLAIYQANLHAAIVALNDATDENKEEAERLKVEGNAAMNNACYTEALDLYTKAIRLDPKNAVYYCNRAATFSKLNNYQQAISDCEIAIDLDPSYSKAYGRLGLAYCGIEDYESALENYKQALALEPTNEGYRQNYDLAKVKVAEMKKEERGATTSAQGTARVMPEVDIAGILRNPQLMNMASQMLMDPQMLNLVASFLNQRVAPQTSAQPPGASGTPPPAGGGGDQSGRLDVDDFILTGQRLAQQIQQMNPELIDEIRSAMNSQVPDLTRNPDTTEKDKKK